MDYSLLGLLASILAVVVSVVALVRSRKTEQAQEQLHAITTELRKAQLAILDTARSESSRATISGHLLDLGNANYFEFTNEGRAAAFNVTLDIQATGPGSNPVMLRDLRDKTPWPKLNPGQSFRIMSARSLGSSRQFKVVVGWTDSAGAVHEDLLFLAF